MLRDSLARPLLAAHARPEREAATDMRALRRALGTFATGVTLVVGRSPAGAPAGLTVNSFASVSLEPPLVLWSLRLASKLLPCFDVGAPFVVHVLRADQEELARRFAAPSLDRFEGLGWCADARGLAVVPQALARFECTVVAGHEAGDHRIVLGRVERYSASDGEPLVFAGGAFHALAREP